MVRHKTVQPSSVTIVYVEKIVVSGGNVGLSTQSVSTVTAGITKHNRCSDVKAAALKHFRSYIPMSQKTSENTATDNNLTS